MRTKSSSASVALKQAAHNLTRAAIPPSFAALVFGMEPFVDSSLFQSKWDDDAARLVSITRSVGAEEPLEQEGGSEALNKPGGYLTALCLLT